MSPGSMKKIIAALIFVSSGAFSQESNEPLSYAEGEYSEIPFRYPSILAVEDVRGIIRLLQEQTEDEISYIQYLPLPGIPNSSSEVQIMLCAKGARLNGTCDQGAVYTVRKVDDKWVYPGEGVGAWEE